MNRPIYVAHAFNAPTQDERDLNRERARRWLAWLAERYEVAPVATWITLTTQWTEERRELGLSIQRTLIELVGTVVLCGERLSDGMNLESSWARQVICLHGMCEWPPSEAGEITIADWRMQDAGIRRRC